jgi:hypothetical protein
MKIIKLFLASSEELKPERLVIAELITKLNYLWAELHSFVVADLCHKIGSIHYFNEEYDEAENMLSNSVNLLADIDEHFNCYAYWLERLGLTYEKEKNMGTYSNNLSFPINSNKNKMHPKMISKGQKKRLLH